MFPLPFVDFPSPILVALLFLSLLYLQFRHPLRVQRYNSWTRIFRNLVLAAPALVLLRLILIPIPYFVAIWAQQHNIGILNWLTLPPRIAATAGALMFDCAYYWWLVGTHRIPLLWRFHTCITPIWTWTFRRRRAFIFSKSVFPSFIASPLF